MKINLAWNVCRICLWESDELLSIYDKDENNQLISDKIATCGGVIIDKEMNLPQQICRKCVAFLNIAYKFHVNCQNSDKILRAFLLDLNSEADFPKQFSDYVAKENHKTETEENSKKSTECTAGEVLIEYVEADIADLPTVEKKEPVAIVEEEHLDQDNLTNNIESGDCYEGIDKLSSDPEYQEPTTAAANKKKPTRRKRYTKSNKKPVNTITLGSDGSAVIKRVEEKPLHICEVCGNKYTKKFALDSHMKWHREEKPFACEICGKKFSINFQLTRHMRTHTGQKPYQCKFCGRKFSDLSTCIKHQRTHTNERPFKCETCGKAFNYSHVLKVHLSVHTGEKPYTCELCGKAFSQLHHLKAHLNTLTHQGKQIDTRMNQLEDTQNIQSIITMLDNDPNSIGIVSD